MVGNMMTFVAIPWFVLETTGSAAKTGIATAAAGLPIIIGGPVGGALVDRVGFRRMSIIADLASGVTVMLIPILYHTVGLAFWQLLVLVFLRGLLDTPGNTARTSMLPDLADQARLPREQVNAASQGIQRGAGLVGPPIAGVLIAFVGASNVLWVDAATFLASAVLIALVVPHRPVSRPAGTGAAHYLGELREGLRFIRRDGLLLAIALSNTFSNFFDGLLTVVAPVYAKEILGKAVDLGLMFSGLGAGAVISLLLFGRFGTGASRRSIFAGGLAGVALGYGALLLAPSRMLVVAAFFVAGLAAGPMNPVLMTVFQERTPGSMRGRVFGLSVAISWSAIPLGRLIGGYLVEGVGLRSTIAMMTSGYLVAALLVLLVPVYRKMDHKKQASVDSHPIDMTS